MKVTVVRLEQHRGRMWVRDRDRTLYKLRWDPADGEQPCQVGDEVELERMTTPAS